MVESLYKPQDLNVTSPPSFTEDDSRRQHGPHPFNIIKSGTIGGDWDHIKPHPSLPLHLDSGLTRVQENRLDLRLEEEPILSRVPDDVRRGARDPLQSFALEPSQSLSASR